MATKYHGLDRRRNRVFVPLRHRKAQKSSGGNQGAGAMSCRGRGNASPIASFHAGIAKQSWQQLPIDIPDERQRKPSAIACLKKTTATRAG
ncbi:hypothetical protein [Novosphingobium panipatense]|uniref:hypothetical protein n=1 Tax=Novosphingobium panipatense TaxID=428991 RepID=UPI0036192BAB